VLLVMRKWWSNRILRLQLDKLVPIFKPLAAENKL
jgi:hypothetical protein